VVPTASFRRLFVFVVLAHHRRRGMHSNVTAHPSSEGLAQQIARSSQGTLLRAPCYMIAIPAREIRFASECEGGVCGKS
jgi:hypothetical protein